MGRKRGRPQKKIGRAAILLLDIPQNRLSKNQRKNAFPRSRSGRRANPKWVKAMIVTTIKMLKSEGYKTTWGSGVGTAFTRTKEILKGYPHCGSEAAIRNVWVRYKREFSHDI